MLDDAQAAGRAPRYGLKNYWERSPMRSASCS
jgi:hypothetical protein